MKIKTKAIFLSLFVVVGLACFYLLYKQGEHSQGIEYIEEARVIYNTNCWMCHGKYGEGNGPTAKVLTPPPPNWTNPKWQSAVTNEGIKNIIIGGGVHISRSDNMPSYPEYADSTALEGLVALVREFGRR